MSLYTSLIQQYDALPLEMQLLLLVMAGCLILAVALFCVMIADHYTNPVFPLQRPVDALQSDVIGRPREPMLAESVEKSAASKDPLLWRDQVRSDVQARLRAMQGGKR